MTRPLDRTIVLTAAGTVPFSETLAAYEAPVFVPTPVPTPSPAFTVLPSITGTARSGQTLTGADGTITNGSVTVRQWLRGTTAITGANGTSYVVVDADVGMTLAYRVTGVGAGGSTPATSANTAVVSSAPTPTPTTGVLDTTIAIPDLFIAKDAQGVVQAGVFPPPLKVMLDESVQGGAYGYELRRGNSFDPATGQVGDIVKTYSGSLTDATATTSSLTVGLVADNITTAFFYDMRLTKGGNFGPWCKPVKHGDTTPASLVSGSTGSVSEELPLNHVLTFNEPVYLSLLGADGGVLEVFGSQPSTSLAVRLGGNGFLDFEAKAFYSFDAVTTDLAGNVATAPVTITVVNKDEAPDPFAFTYQGGVAVGQDTFSNEITVSGIDATITTPVLGRHRVNGGAIVTASRVATGDKVQAVAKMTTGQTTASTTVSIGGVTSTFSIYSTQPLWTPMEFGDRLVIWLDPSDGATFTGGSGGLAASLTSMASKGPGAARNLTTAATTPPQREAVGSRAVLHFFGSNSYADISATGLPFGSSPGLMALTGNFDGGDYLWAAAYGGSANGGLRNVGVSRANGAVYGVRGGNDFNNPVTGYSDADNYFPIIVDYEGGPSASSKTSLNGSTPVTKTQTVNTQVVPNLRLNGYDSANTNGSNFKVGDVIAVNGVVTEPERLKLEGWLAHKWAPVSGSVKLRADHPYKTTPPTI